MARNWSLPENWYPLFLGMYPLFVASQLAANDHAKLGSVNLALTPNGRKLCGTNNLAVSLLR